MPFRPTTSHGHKRPGTRFTSSRRNCGRRYSRKPINGIHGGVTCPGNFLDDHTTDCRFQTANVVDGHSFGRDLGQDRHMDG